MKTRRKTVKTPAKGRRSSIICVRKSPIVRRNPRRTVRNPPKTPKLTTYESPLVHLYHNGPSDGPLTSTTNKQIKNENTEDNDEEERKCSVINLPSTSKNSVKIEPETRIVDVKDEHKIDELEQINRDMDINLHTENFTLPKSKKRSLVSRIGSGEIPKPKKRKPKKSPLSKINETNESNKLSDSVILIDDSEFHLKTEPSSNEITQSTLPNESMRNISLNEPTKHTLLHEPMRNISSNEPTKSNIFIEPMRSVPASEFTKTTLFNQPSTSCTPVEPFRNSILTGTAKNTEDIVVIDCNNDNSFMEMEAYHDAFKSGNSSANSKFMDSVIVIDQDDEPPVQTDVISKPSEDCFVVWSSLPKPCTSNNLSNTEPSVSNKQSWINDNADLLKCDKILIDTKADTMNLSYLNNENNKPKRKTLKSPKVNPRKVSVKAASKATKVAKTTTKSVTKTAATATVKRKAKNSGELIFLSESKVDDETKTKKVKSKKGKLREIVIDGSNVAMAYTNNKAFSEKGIKMLIDYFTKKGHTVKVFVPQYRRSRNFPLLEKWHSDGIVVFTPSRKLGNKFITPYDDRYILEYATACDGIVVSQDQFRDLYAEKPQYRDTIENRLLVPTFVGDYVMFPEDPLGRDGPTLADFLKH